MKRKDFINILNRLANETPTRYYLGGVGEHEGNTFLFDCCGLQKSVLWGFNFDYSKYRGGAIYQSNGVPDVNANVMFNDYCYNKSSDFTNIEIGEFVWLEGHIGTYIGNGKVIESTGAWENKVLVSEIGNNGERSYKGNRCLRWKYHGKSKFIEYDEPVPTSEYYKVVGGDLWLRDDFGNKIRTYPNDTIVKCLGNSYDLNGYHYYKVEVLIDSAIGNMACSYLEPTEPPYIDYEKLYKEEVIKNEKLTKEVNNLNDKIKKAIKDLT